ncbi:hypothetical protein NERG_01032 [Nematocida ausubeli]|uniref:Uncharacterized protein n=1 Tax=Nematocida ausubeli (strain ATCC PRA-371 / ERTm2) TaxID=1913371 RepID=H8ZBT3_NEMA1|nr:hypothetical protein NERG_01032 [Nematocida ausubeli]
MKKFMSVFVGMLSTIYLGSLYIYVEARDLKHSHVMQEPPYHHTVERRTVNGDPAVNPYASEQTSSHYKNPDTSAEERAPPQKETSFYSNKHNVGFLYNVGSKKYIGADSAKYWLNAVDDNTPPLPIAIVESYGQSIGSYYEIISVDSVSKPNFGTRSSNDLYTNVKRFDVGGGPSQKRCYLYGHTSVYNRFVITPSYYKKDDSFKIRRSTFCLGVASNNQLLEMACVDDTTNGKRTEENDRQLFKFCRADSGDRCVSD